MRCLVTGNAGWIGKAVNKRLLDEGLETVPYDLVINRDILDTYQLYKQMIDVDMVFHLAGETGVSRSWFDPYIYYQNNTLGSAKVFRVARELNKKVIYASTGEVYVGNSPYAASKIGAEAAMRSELLKGADIVALRILNPYGVGQPESYIIPKFLKLAIEDKPITIHGDGEQRKDYLYITDIAEAFWSARELQAGTFADLGTGETKSIKEIANDVIKLTNSKSEVVFVPSPRTGEAQVLQKAPEHLFSIGWKPQVNWEEGLENVRKSL